MFKVIRHFRSDEQKRCNIIIKRTNSTNSSVAKKTIGLI